MAQRRMFSPDIVCSEEFLEMPPSSRELYFQLGMRADDDGFIQPKSVIRSIGAKEDDLRVLVAKRFVLPFDNGVVVVKHWLIHNMIRSDRYKPTRFQEEKNTLYIKSDKSYTDNSENGVPLLATKWQPNGNHPAPQVRLGKGSIISEQSSQSYEIREGTDEDKPSRVSGKERQAYESLLKWAEEERGSVFVHRPKQYGALKQAKSVGLKSTDLKERWLEMSEQEYWQKNGFDWVSVVASFNKKGV